MKFYADGNKNQSLMGHIKGVSCLAAKFAADFSCNEWGKLAGLWHDLGKYNIKFQNYMLKGGPQVEHAVVGGRYATNLDDAFRKIALQIIITCHHTGLQNNGRIQQRISRATELLEATLPYVPSELLNKKCPYLPSWLKPPFYAQEDRRHLEFWIRILHSCLVDADWLDAEKRNYLIQERPEFPEIAELRDVLDSHIDKKVETAKEENWTKVNRQRELVLKACRTAAEQKTGFFSLTVPTGGGKTLSAMSFALNHAVKNDLKRVIVVIPFTSIISQNATVYGKIFCQENVIEHHASLSPQRDTERNRLASENWDAPVIVTTNVQFFESLYANKNTKLRKLHNIARSVVILDEVQSLPPGLLYAILDGLKELQQHYGCSIVLSTATQPALQQSDFLKEGLEHVQEIIPNTISLARNLNRVNVDWKIHETTEYEDIAQQIADEKMARVLVVTHTRKDARYMAELLPGNSYHLSAAMCPAHKQDIIDKACAKLKQKDRDVSVHLVSTQLIEAGVDIDFPVVFRALAGLDSLSQTAGRCNREGKEKDGGRFIIFRAPSEPPRGVLRMGKDITETMINSNDMTSVARCSNGDVDLTSPENYQTYFRLFYSHQRLDNAGVQTCREKLDFSDVAQRFKVIDTQTFPIVVPYGKSYVFLKSILQKEFLTREDFRYLQPFIVQIYKPDMNRLEDAGALDSVGEKSFYYLTPAYERLYHKRFGLITEEENIYPDESVLIQ